MFKLILAIALLLLAACDPYAQTSKVHEIAAAEAADAISPLRSQVADLEGRIETLQSQLDAIDGKIRTHSSTLSDVASSNAETSRRVSKNARVSNDNALDAMTRRGACGAEMTAVEGGGVLMKNKPCTIDDLR